MPLERLLTQEIRDRSEERPTPRGYSGADANRRRRVAASSKSIRGKPLPAIDRSSANRADHGRATSRDGLNIVPRSWPPRTVAVDILIAEPAAPAPHSIDSALRLPRADILTTSAARALAYACRKSRALGLTNIECTGKPISSSSLHRLIGASTSSKSLRAAPSGRSGGRLARAVIAVAPARPDVSGPQRTGAAIAGRGARFHRRTRLSRRSGRRYPDLPAGADPALRHAAVLDFSSTRRLPRSFVQCYGHQFTVPYIGGVSRLKTT